MRSVNVGATPVNQEHRFRSFLLTLYWLTLDWCQWQQSPLVVIMVLSFPHPQVCNSPTGFEWTYFYHQTVSVRLGTDIHCYTTLQCTNCTCTFRADFERTLNNTAWIFNRAESPFNTVILGPQLWLWSLKPQKPIVLNSGVQEAANQEKKKKKKSWIKDRLKLD